MGSLISSLNNGESIEQLHYYNITFRTINDNNTNSIQLIDVSHEGFFGMMENFDSISSNKSYNFLGSD
jgi:hypothetical protein